MFKKGMGNFCLLCMHLSVVENTFLVSLNLALVEIAAILEWGVCIVLDVGHEKFQSCF